MGYRGKGKAIFDYVTGLDDTPKTQTLEAVRKVSEAGYERYCEYHAKDLGTPDKEAVLGYWAFCLDRQVQPGVEDMVTSRVADRDQAPLLLRYLQAQWMGVPQFVEWLHQLETKQGFERISTQQKETTTLVKTLVDDAAQQKIQRVGKLLTPGYVANAAQSFTAVDMQNFYRRVDNRFPTILRVIGADRDVSNREGVEKGTEVLQTGTPLMITGNGGQGKTCLMLRLAVEWVQQDQHRLVVWVGLTGEETFTRSEVEEFYQALTELTLRGEQVLLCIDSPFAESDFGGKKESQAFKALQDSWPNSDKIQLMLAERTNRLNRLEHPNNNSLLYWFDTAQRMVLGEIPKPGKGAPWQKTAIYIPANTRQREIILQRCTNYLANDNSISPQKQEEVIRQMLGKPYVNLVELIYETFFRLQEAAPKGRIMLDWDEWASVLGRPDDYIELYGIIAALNTFGLPVSTFLFCRCLSLDQDQFSRKLLTRLVSRHVEPVRIQDQLLRPKHDIIAQLFFKFHKELDKDTGLINTLMLQVLQSMNELETQDFLLHILKTGKSRPKDSVQKGRVRNKRTADKILYWNYMNTIYDRTQAGGFILPDLARAYLCLGLLWAAKDMDVDLQPMLEHTAPPIASEFEGEHELMAKVYTEWGIWAKEKGRNDVAEAKFRAVITHDSKNIHARTELGRLLSKLGRDEEAVTYLKEILNFKPNDIQARTELGRLLSKLGRDEEAEQYLLEILVLDPKNIQARTELGRLLSKLGRDEKAEQYLLEILVLDPKNIQARTELGRLLSKLSRDEEAVTYLKEIIQLDPKNIHSRTELGQLYVKLGKNEKAEEILLAAIAVNPKDPKTLPPRDVLAKLYETQGNLDGAGRLYQELCDLEPDNPYGLAGLARLKRKGWSN